MSKCHHTAAIAVLISALNLLAPAFLAAADNAAQQIFNDLYKSRIDAVGKTLSREDDLKLASELLSVSKQGGIDANLKELLCNNTYELGMRSKAGYATAIEAMRLLASQPGAKGSDVSSKLLDAMNRQYLSASGDERTTLGEAIFDQYIEMGDAQVQAGAPDEAVKLYRKAALAAGRIRSPKIADAKARIEWAIARQRTQRNIERLEEALLRNATDTASAKTLTLIYLTEMDNPATAAKYAPRSGDDELKAVTPLAAKPFPQLTPAELMKLGEWYQSQGERASANQRIVVMTNAQKYLLRFIELGRGTNLENAKAKLLLSSANKVLESVTRSGPPTARPPNQSKRVKFIPIENVKEAFGLGSKWNVKEGVLSGYAGDIGPAKRLMRFPISASQFVYGFKIKAKWYHTAYFTLADRGNVPVLVSVGFWENQGTYVSVAGRQKSRSEGKVEHPEKWAQLEVQMRGDRTVFFYNGMQVAEYIFLKKVEAVSRFKLGFASHETEIAVRDFYVIADGKMLEELPVGK